MKKNRPRRSSCALALAWALTGQISLARGEDVILIVTAAPEPVTVGGHATLWLTALNASDHEVAWTFPPIIQGKTPALRGALAGSLAWHSRETNAVSIAPGGFARREYAGAGPDVIPGRVVLEFPELQANPVLLEVQPPARNAAVTTNQNDSVFKRFIREAETTTDKGEGPGRFFKEHISGYEPMYILAGTKSPNAKFQISFAYQLLNSGGPLAEKAPALKGFKLAYTQTSLWDWNTDSAPLYDTTYKPEVFYAWSNVTAAAQTNWIQLDLQSGLQHESNGKSGADSRNFNIAYLQPTLTIGRDAGLQIALQPRVWAYLGSRSDNPDIADYYGYANLKTTVGWKRGLQLAAVTQMGKEASHPSLQLDLTYPTMKFFGSFSLYLDVQYFNGYGESLLGYNQKSEALRIGFALYR